MIDIIENFKSIISDYSIIQWENEPSGSRFKSQIKFIDGSSLFIKEYLLSDGRKYSYHWQDIHGNLIIRWDNSKHWHHISTYPHHKHKEGNIIESTEISMEDILQFIYNNLKHAAIPS
jgi:hypothetical protein